MRRVNLVAAGIALSALSACATTTEPASTAGMVLEAQYTNFAWVPTWKGFVVDTTGAVYSFDLDGKQWNPSDPEHPTPAELASKYATGRKLVRTLSRAETQTMFSLANDAAAGSLTAPQGRCADAGNLTYSVYRGLDESRTQRVLLRAEGDLMRANTADAARKLTARLESLGLLTPITGCQP